MEENKNLNVEVTPEEENKSEYSALTSSNNTLAASLKKDAATHTFLILLAIAVVFPFYWMIISSLKTYDEYILSTPTFWPTEKVYWQNYADAYSAANLGTLFLNTVYVGLVSTLLSLVITTELPCILAIPDIEE